MVKTIYLCDGCGREEGPAIVTTLAILKVGAKEVPVHVCATCKKKFEGLSSYPAVLLALQSFVASKLN